MGMHVSVYSNLPGRNRGKLTISVPTDLVFDESIHHKASKMLVLSRKEAQQLRDALDGAMQIADGLLGDA